MGAMVGEAVGTLALDDIIVGEAVGTGGLDELMVGEVVGVVTGGIDMVGEATGAELELTGTFPGDIVGTGVSVRDGPGAMVGALATGMVGDVWLLSVGGNGATDAEGDADVEGAGVFTPRN